MDGRSLVTGMRVALLAAFLAFPGCSSDALRPAGPAAPSLLAEVTIPEALQFPASDGTIARLPAGDYLLAAEGDSGLLAVGPSGLRTVLSASADRHGLELPAAVALVLDRGAGRRDLALLLPDGTSRIAGGFDNGPRMRGVEPWRPPSSTLLSITAARNALREFLGLSWLSGVPVLLDSELATLAQIVREVESLLAALPMVDRVAFGRVLALLEASEDRLSTVRADLERRIAGRQAAQTAFEGFDQKANQLFNLLSTVMKNEREMESGIARNML